MSATEDLSLGEVTLIALESIGVDQGVRSGTLDLDHASRLAEVIDLLPPIVLRLNEERYELIDGSHRCAAHRLAGRTEIPAVVMQCTDVRAIEWATSANVSHGRPLTTDDRKRSAKRLMEMDSEMSDRSIAASCGLSNHTVASLRPEPRSTGSGSQLNGEPKRAGLDGKRRPTPEQAKANRAKAEEIAAAEPDIPTGDLAERAGVSRGTAHAAKKAAAEEAAEPAPPGSHLRDVSATPEQRAAASVGDVAIEIPQSWTRLPQAKRSNDGRDFCGWMDRRSIRGDDREALASEYAEKCPAELLEAAVAAARLNAQAWAAFADAAEARQTHVEVVR